MTHTSTLIMLAAGTMLGALGASLQDAERIDHLESQVEYLLGRVSGLTDYAEGQMFEDAWLRVSLEDELTHDGLKLKPWMPAVFQMLEDSADISVVSTGVQAAEAVYGPNAPILEGKQEQAAALGLSHRATVRLVWAKRLHSLFEEAKERGLGGLMRADYEDLRSGYTENDALRARALPTWLELVEMWAEHDRAAGAQEPPNEAEPGDAEEPR